MVGEEKNGGFWFCVVVNDEDEDGDGDLRFLWWLGNKTLVLRVGERKKE